MEVIIASTVIPFIEGGGTFIVDGLEQTLKEFGHSVCTLKIPFHSDYRNMADQMLGLRLLDIRKSAERLITIRTPSYLLRHPSKVIWFIHHHRTAYDMWNTPYREIPDTPEGRAYRDLVYSADMLAFREARKIYTNSKVVGDRLRRFNRIESDVLYPPLMNPELYRGGRHGDYILYVSRVVHHKRQDLVVESMVHTKTPVRLVIAGKTDTPRMRDKMFSLIEAHKLHDRVLFSDEWISDQRKQELIAGCAGCIYVPQDEDSYGYPTLEAFHACKPVITTSDAGGTLEIIQDSVNGLIAQPTPESIAAAMDRLFLDEQLARQMGAHGLHSIEKLGIRWDRVVEKLLQ
jgi:glycosyltransferase involved in cell wall biosynthesis